MIIEAKMFSVGCLSCDLMTSFHGSPESAKEEAEDQGWQIGDTHRCPKCWAAQMPSRLRIVG